MRSKQHLRLLAMFCGCLVMVSVAAAEEFTVGVENLNSHDQFSIEVFRQDGQTLDTAVFDVFVEDAGDWDLCGTGTSEDYVDASLNSLYDVLLVGIDPDLVTADWSSEDPTVLVVEVAPVAARIKFDPRSLNVDSNGNWINCKIQLPNAYPITGIRGGTVEVTISGEVEQDVVVDGQTQTVTVPYEITDLATSRVQVMRRFVMVKINRSDITDELVALGANGAALVSLVGELDGGLYFEGTQTIKVINKTVAKAVRSRARDRRRNR